MKYLDVRLPEFANEFQQVLSRGKMDMKEVSSLVQELLDEIRTEGLDALKKHIARFDKWEVKSFEDLRISPKECLNAYNQLSSELKSALHLAYDRIYAFHRKQKMQSWIDCEENEIGRAHV